MGGQGGGVHLEPTYPIDTARLHFEGRPTQFSNLAKDYAA